MKLLKDFKGNCCLGALSILLDISPEELSIMLGHNGLDIIPAEKFCIFRCFHPLELTYLCFKLGYALILFEKNPQLIHYGHKVDYTQFLGEEIFYKALTYGDGVIFGETKKEGHSVAWNCEEKLVYDSRGFKYELGSGDFRPFQFFLLRRIQNE